MPAPAWEDLDVFLQVDDFACKACISTISGHIYLVGLFDDPYAGARLGEYDRDTQTPTFNCKAADVMGLVHRGDTITLQHPDGTSETLDIMTDPQPDGTGMAILELARP